MRARGWFDHVSALRDINTVCRMSPSLPGTLFARTHALAQTVGGTWRISKDAAVSCAGARLCAPGRSRKMDPFLGRKAEREQSLSGK